MCSPGFYCPPGTTAMVPCPSGTYSSSKGASSLDNCKSCPPGLVCDSQGLVNTNSICPEGYYCPKDISTSTPSSYVCFVGCECPAGSIWPKPCQPGYY